MLWIKALHIISFTAWFAGLFYLPRLFVYHSMSDDNISLERFIVMERKLYLGIMMPSMALTLFFGGWMLIQNWGFYKTQGWMHTKLGLAFLLIGYHHVCGAHLKRLARGINTRTHVYFRWFNEVPVLFLSLIVILAIVKPF